MDELSKMLFEMYLGLPGWAWLAIGVGSILLLSIAGIVAAKSSSKKIAPDGLKRASHVIVPEKSAFRARKTVFVPKNLSTQTGQLVGEARTANPGVDQPGYLSFGPYVTLRNGRYRVTLNHASDASEHETVGTWDVWNADKGTAVFEGSVVGTVGKPKAVDAVIIVPEQSEDRYEFRFFWNGAANFRLDSIELEHL